MSFLMNRFFYLRCPKCQEVFGLPWDLITNAYCPKCKSDVSVIRNKLPKPSEELQIELKRDYHYRKFEAKLVR